MNIINKDLTILLVLKGRPLFTWRWMRWADAVKLPFKVIIADGGKDKDVEKILSEHKEFPGVDYEYVRYPYDENLSCYYRKMKDALSRVKTPFVVHTANDDFYLIEGLVRCVEFLKKNEEHVSAGGDNINFIVGPYEKFGDLIPYYGKFSVLRDVYEMAEIDAPSATGRLRQYANGDGDLKVALWAAVYRTGVLIDIYREMESADFQDLRFADLLFYFLAVIAGKIKRMEGFYFFHQANPGASEGAVVQRKYPTFRSWTEKANWAGEYEKMVDRVIRFASTKSGDPQNALKSDLGKIIKEGYLEAYLRDDLKMPVQKMSDNRFVKYRGAELKKIIAWVRPDCLAGKGMTFLYRKVLRQGAISHGSANIDKTFINHNIKDVVDFVERVPSKLGI